MCLAVLRWQPNENYPIKIVANRDEFRQRPTESMHWWAHDNILSGKDLQAGGSWLGLNTEGRFALLTNIRPGYIGSKGQRSRGELVTSFLSSTETLENIHAKIKPSIADFGGFNIIVGNLSEVLYFSSNHPDGQYLEPGVHALSNDSLNTPWPKSLAATSQMTQFHTQMESSLTEHPILSSCEKAQDDRLPSTGIPYEWEKLLSSQTIPGEEYGTLSRTHILMSKSATCFAAEQKIDKQGLVSETREFKFDY